MLDNETKRRIDTARDILVGKVPDPKSQVEQITIALIYKFMDDMDMEAEELGGERNFFKGEFERYAWRKIFDRSLGGYEMLNLYSEAILKMNQNPQIPQLFRDIFKNAYLPYRDPETLKSFLKVINDFSYDHSEKLGDAFEYLLSVLGSQGDAGQFRTPRHIIDFMVEIIDPQKHETILDPACGTAGFLISAYKHIIKNNSSNYDPVRDPAAFEIQGIGLDELGAVNGKKYKGDKLLPEERNRLVSNIRGYDISPDMVRLSLVNLYLHGFVSPNIFEYDTLTSEERWNEYADVILANPPFMSPKGGIRPHKRFSVTSSRSEVLFVDYMAEHLTPTGKAAIIVPEGIIFQSGTAYKALRKMLVEENYLVGVISLPAGVFQPYSGVKTSILWLDRSLAKRTDKILFVKISHDGFDLGAQRRPIKQNDMPEAFRQITRYKHSLLAGQSFDTGQITGITVVEKSKIGESVDYNLSGERYKLPDIGINTKYDLVEIGTICSFEYGKPLKEENRIDGQYPVFGSNGIVGYHSEFIVPGPFIVVGRKGSAGAIHYSDLNGFPIDTTFYIKLANEEKVNLKFLFNILKSLKLGEVNVQAGVPGLNRNDAYKIKIPLPPISIQSEIVDEIEGYQKIIDGARQVVENWKPRIDIDSDWPVVLLGDHIDFLSGLTLSIPDCEAPGGTPIISMNSLTEDGELIKEGIRTIELPNKKNIIYLKKGDLLFNWRNGSRRLVGKTGYFDWEGNYVFASFLLGIRPRPNSYNSRFLWILLNQFRREGSYENFMRQNVNGLFNREELKILPVPLPRIEIQQRIVSQIDTERTFISTNKDLIILFEQKIKDRIARVWGSKINKSNYAII